MRTDLLLLWPLNAADPGQPPWTRWQGPVQKAVIELKILYKSLEGTIADGLKQTWDYMDRCGVAEGHLVVFDRRSEVQWTEKVSQRQEGFQGEEIGIWGM